MLTTPLLALLSAFFLQNSAHASPISLSEYLNQVEGASPAVSASQNNFKGTLQTAKESVMIFMPRFTLQASHMLDERQNSSSAFFGNRTTTDNFTAGIEKQFSFGLNTKLSYGFINNQTSGASPLLFPPYGSNGYNNAQTQIDLTQSLWRNFLGEESKATAKRDEATALVLHYQESFHLKQLRAQAESAYYRLAIARQAVQLQQELLDRAKKILDWSTKRVNNRIADRVDLLQAKTAYQQRELELQAGLDEEKSASLAFNQIRNSIDSDVKEELKTISIIEVINLTLPQKVETSDDIKASEQNERVSVANQEISKQKTLPDLALFATAAYNGVNTYLSPALGDSFSTKHPMYTVGVKFSFPLYFWETSEMRQGRVKQQLAAEAATQQKRLENQQTWQDLNQKINTANTRLKMADELVNAQKEKIDYERYRLNLGRTTTYQVLTFEQDYSQSLIQRLRIEQELLNLHSQLKTYAQD